MRVVKQLHRRLLLLARDLTHFLRFVLLSLSYRLFPSKASPKRKLLSAHLNDKNARKGTGKSSSSSTVLAARMSVTSTRRLLRAKMRMDARESACRVTIRPGTS